MAVIYDTGTWKGGEPWWGASRDAVHDEVMKTVRHIEGTPEEQARRQEDLDHARLYGNRFFRGLGPFSYTKPIDAKTARDERLRLNICRAVTDTATALIAGKSRPKATLLTTGGDWTARRRAKRADRFVEGAFRDVGVYTLGPRTFRTAGIFGTAAIKFFSRFGRIEAEQVLPCELLVDPVDGLYERPRTLYHAKIIDRGVLAAMYPAKARALKSLKPYTEDLYAGQSHSTVAQPIRVVEAWHLPSGPESKDGRHVIAVDTVTLLDEPWTIERFPFAFFRWSPRVVGFWGTGLIEEIKPLQLEINVTLKRISECLRLMAVPRIFMQSTANAIKSIITNEVGSIIPYTGPTPPQQVVPPAVPPELFTHLQWCVQQGFQQPGVSQMSATSQKPAGLDSGRAIREFNDLGSERFADRFRAYEDFHLDMAEVIMALAEDMADGESGGWAVTRATRRSAERIRWSDVRLDRDSYVLQVQSTSALPRDVAGRTQTVAEWQAQGWVDATKAQRLLDLPDLDAETSIAFAGQEVVDAKIERMLDHDPVEDAYDPPEPYDDLAYGIRTCQLTLNRERAAEAPEERLELLRQWITDAQALMSATQPAASPAMAPAPALPAPQPPVPDPTAMGATLQ